MNRETEETFFDSFRGNLLLSIPIDLIRNKELKPLDIMVYEIITSLSYQKGYCWASNNYIADVLHVGSNKTIQTSINRLELHNYIRKNSVYVNGTLRRRIYTISIAREIEIETKRKSMSAEELKALDFDWIHER